LLSRFYGAPAYLVEVVKTNQHESEPILMTDFITTEHKPLDGKKWYHKVVNSPILHSKLNGAQLCCRPYTEPERDLCISVSVYINSNILSIQLPKDNIPFVVLTQVAYRIFYSYSH